MNKGVLACNEDQVKSEGAAVLLYHRIGVPRPASLVAGQYVMPRLLCSQLDYLTKKGWRSATLSGIFEDDSTQRDKSDDRFVVTFDDGYRGVHDAAYPILAERQIEATVYVVAGHIGGINEWDRRAGDTMEPLLSEAEIREMAGAGFEIGSHSLSHAHLTALSDHDLREEIVDSKHRLEDLIGGEVASFSYPYGDCDDRVRAFVVEAGYTNAVTTSLGALGQCDRFAIPRVNVRWNAVGPLLAGKIARARKRTEREP